MKNLSVTDWCAGSIRKQVKPGDLCIDATMGNGNDTLLLSRLCGKDGHVFAFDIQEQALKNTSQLLESAQAEPNYTLLLDSHEHMDQYVQTESVSCIVFNFGYLPGGDHKKSTHADSSLAAIQIALSLLKKEGLLSLCIYSGGDTGFEERDAILSYLKDLDPKKYLVIKTEYYNRVNHPPIPVMVIKL